MKILPKVIPFLLILFLCENLFAQNENLSDYYLIQRRYENRLENDSTALPLVNEFIKKAKSEKNYEKLFRGYKDALLFSRSPQTKLKYADSVIGAAKLTRNDAMLSDAYMNKGVVYYFNLKKYNQALEQYLIAYKLCENGKDLFHKNRLKYHIGVVKSYVGYYNEALTELKGASRFFEEQTKLDIHPNLMFNHQRGYYNSLHQMAICYRNLQNFKSADSIVELGLSSTYKNLDYQQEYAYFQKEKAISRYYHKDYESATLLLSSSIKSFIQVGDFATTAIAFSYLGKSELKLGKPEQAISHFKNVDSIFNKHAFMVPELRSMYEMMIDYYGAQGNPEEMRYYNRQLVKADKIISKDFLYLSSKIHREYDASLLMKEQRKLVRNKYTAVFGIGSLLLGAMIYWLYRKRHRTKLFAQRGKLDNLIVYNRADIDKEIVDRILLKLDGFERNHKFIKKGISLRVLATQFDISHSYLSQIINEHKGVNFKRYMIELKIGYITEKLLNDPKYLKYTTEALSKACGISSRSNFSKWFYLINGVRPTEFIRNRLEIVEMNQEHHPVP